MTVKQLRKLCQKNRLTKYSKLTKKSLINLLSAHFLTKQAKTLELTSIIPTKYNLPIIVNFNKIAVLLKLIILSSRG